MDAVPIDGDVYARALATADAVVLLANVLARLEGPSLHGLAAHGPYRLAASSARALADLVLLNPLQQRLRRAADLRGYRLDCSP